MMSPVVAKRLLACENIPASRFIDIYPECWIFPPVRHLHCNLDEIGAAMKRRESMRTPALMPILVAGILALHLWPLSVQAAAAQGEGKPFRVGAKVGVNRSDFHSRELGSNRPGAQVGVIGGMFISYSLVDWFAVEPEVLYSEKGARFSGSDIGLPDAEARLHLDCVELPVLARFSIPFHGALSPAFLIGPDFAFNVSRKVNFSAGNLDQTISYDDIPGAAPFETFEFNMVFGAGLDISLHPVQLTLEARYTLGLTDIVSPPNLNTSPKNYVISFLAGIAF
jgi:hypothetical protein